VPAALTEPGRRERKKAATRVALFHAARDLVEERGLAAVTVEAIAERADVAPRTFFNHFASKEEAVLGWDPASSLHVADDVRAGRARGHDPLTAVERALTALVVTDAITSTDLRRRLALLRSEPMLLATSFSHWEQLHDGIVDALEPAGPADPDPHLLVHFAVAAVRAALRCWSLGGDGSQDQLRRAIASSFAALRSGLAVPDPPTTDDLSRELQP
jgi:AcrR family transcriptional regulator